MTATNVERPLAGRVALITGAASGIGRAVVDRFVYDGAQVVALDVSKGGLAALDIAHGQNVHGVIGDVRNAEDNQRAVAAARETFGSLDVFVGNAGVFDAELALADLPADVLVAAANEIFGVNIVGYLLGAQAAAAALRERRGAMVFTASNASFEPASGGGILYTTAKHAVVGLVRQLAHEFAPEVRVNGVAPGGTITGLRIADTLRPIAGVTHHFADPAAAERAIARTNPLGIVPRPSDHAALYALLASDQTAAVTGQIISSDGGLSVRGLALHRTNEEGTR